MNATKHCQRIHSLPHHKGSRREIGTPSCLEQMENRLLGSASPLVVTLPPAAGVPDLAAGAMAAAVNATMHQQYVSQLYSDLLHRPADPAGQAYWTGLLDSGADSYAAVAQAITGSSEYESKAVDGIYFQYLGRHANAPELNAGVGQMQAGVNQNAIQAAVLGTNEYYQLQGGTDAGFINALYRAFVGRAPEQGEVPAWQQVLGTKGRTFVASAISNSGQHMQSLAASFYQLYLQRNADAPGLAFWTQQLVNGISQPQIVSTFVSCAEYLAMHVAPAAPSGLSATGVTGGVLLTWTNNDPAATGYLVLCSTDGQSFHTLTTVSGGTVASYLDTAAVAGQAYTYMIQAVAGGAVSAASNAVAAAALQPTSNHVSVTTRYGDEIVVTATGSNDDIAVSQKGASLVILADGLTYTYTAPAAGLFIYTRGGADDVSILTGVTERTTVETIDGSFTTITANGSNVSAWIDATDAYSGGGTVHRVADFAGGVSKAQGDSLADPSDSGHTTVVHASLWGTGPTMSDINQGEVGDCYFLASLAAFAGVNPSVVKESAVDMGDGTYVVQFDSGNTPAFVRVSADLPAGGFKGLAFAHPGAAGTIWGAVLEKAFAYFRTGANTYDSINSGWMGDVYALFGVNSNSNPLAGATETSFYKSVSTALAAHHAVTFSTPGDAPNLVGDHAYTLVSAVTDAQGVAHYTVRNPWGVAGDNLENNAGYATLTFAQLMNNFDWICQATN